MYIVITGTSRGIGFALTQLCVSQGHHVMAIARNIDDSALSDLKNKFKNLETLNLDITEKNAPEKIAQALAIWPMVDVLINNAGVYHDDDKIEDFEKSFLTNSIMPLFITRSLMPHLKKSESPLSLQITSMMGSISDNTSGGSYSYRSSKAALNMIYKGLAIDEKWLHSLLIHPGWVQTRMGGTSAPVAPEVSAKGILEIISDAGKYKDHQFIDYQGKKLNW